jgi:hypothetical protein
MSRDHLPLIGDFVKYIGNFSVASGPLRNEGTGRICGFEVFNGVERIDLFLRDRVSNIWCDYELIRAMQTEEKHLINSGYELQIINNRKRYKRGESIISGAILIVPQLALTIITGYCTADFTGGLTFDKYLPEDGLFNFQLFYQDFPSVNNINEFFDYLKSQHLELNWEAIAGL